MCAATNIHDTSHITYNSLLEGNKAFVERALEEDPDYFTKLANGQKPPVLWIGCADSRVPANQITNTQPGEIFVHRNIANVVVHTDMNMLSVLDYAVSVLKVEHVIITGHYGCGGVIAAMGNQQFGIIDSWLSHIKDVYSFHKAELNAIEDEKERTDRLVELNVMRGVENISKTPIVQNAWKNGQSFNVHGWVYSLETGLITDLKVSANNNENLEDIFRLV